MKALILFLSIFTFIACDNNSTKYSITTFTEIGKGSLYGNGEEGISQSNKVISNSEDWQTLIDQMNSINHVTDHFEETNIDFESFTVIAVFLEVKQHGSEVEISKIEEDINSIIVSTTETEYEYLTITQAFHIVKIPITNKTIKFN